jgi:hypothetical protein
MSDMDPTVEEPEGDPVPLPSRDRSSADSSGEPKPKRARRGRPPKDASVEPLLPDAPKPSSRRTSKEAKDGGEAIWGLAGTVAMFGGQATGQPGAVAAGFVMQAQARDGGIWLAQRLMETRYYPYLERVGKGGAGMGVVAAPVVAALFVSLPPLRPVLAPIAASMLGDLQVDMQVQNPDTGEVSVQKVSVWAQIQGELAAAEQEAAAQAMAQAAAAGPPEAERPLYDEPEPGVHHVRSPYNDLADEAYVPPGVPPEI